MPAFSVQWDFLFPEPNDRVALPAADANHGILVAVLPMEAEPSVQEGDELALKERQALLGTRTVHGVPCNESEPEDRREGEYTQEHKEEHHVVPHVIPPIPVSRCAIYHR
jgi:hypothetical protein